MGINMAIFRKYVYYSALLSLLVLYSGLASAGVKDLKAGKFVFNNATIPMQGKVCSQEFYEEGSSDPHTIVEYYYEGMVEGQLHLRRVVKVEDGKEVNRKDAVISENLSQMRNCVFEPTPGNRLRLDVDNMQQLSVTDLGGSTEEMVAVESAQGDQGTVSQEELDDQL
ncbi:MAG: hypothetical protein ABIJ27_00230 [Candidatus Omnitrophota bacterium]